MWCLRGIGKAARNVFVRFRIEMSDCIRGSGHAERPAYGSVVTRVDLARADSPRGGGLDYSRRLALVDDGMQQAIMALGERLPDVSRAAWRAPEMVVLPGDAAARRRVTVLGRGASF